MAAGINKERSNKLTPSDIRMVLKMNEYKFTISDIAQKFKVHKSTITRIIRTENEK